MVSSIAHSGSGEWENIGMQALTKIDKNPMPKINLNNKDQPDTLIVYLTSPSFNTGPLPPQRNAAVITGAGGIISGTVTNGLCRKYSFIKGTNYLVLPKSGNVFIIEGTDNTISRINYSNENRFPEGTIITLLFNKGNNIVSGNSYIELKSPFVSSGKNTSLTIISNGDGTWREVNRNN